MQALKYGGSCGNMKRLINILIFLLVQRPAKKRSIVNKIFQEKRLYMPFKECK